MRLVEVPLNLPLLQSVSWKSGCEGLSLMLIFQPKIDTILHGSLL
jgi:hypothetical protein